jgi:PAS domain S-box-containing protein
MFGYEPHELIENSRDLLLPQRFKKNHSNHRASYNNNPHPRRMGIGRDLVAIRKDSSEFPVEVSLSHKEVDGHFLVMAFIIDITERKQAEEALRQSEEQLIVYAAELEKKVHARTEALNESILQLEAANKDLQEQISERKKAEEETRRALKREKELNELKSRFVSTASHEFRTPLSTILSSASLVDRYKDSVETDKIAKHVKRIKSSVNHLTGILNDFLSLGKLEEGRIDLTLEKIQLDSFIKEVCEEMIPTLQEGQKININCRCDLDEIETDPRILRNILFNLLSNASKYSLKNRTIHINCVCENNVIILQVRDEGIGIPKEDIKHITERFFRASNVINIQGSGLGLNIVRRYIDLLGGNINFVSEEGKGTTFNVTLPIA